jgi:hypothetical protein
MSDSLSSFKKAKKAKFCFLGFFWLNFLAFLNILYKFNLKNIL